MLRLSYEIHRFKMNFPTLANNYIQKRRSEMLKDDCNVPILNVRLGDFHTHPSAFENVHQVMCFERDLAPSKPAAADAVVSSSKARAQDIKMAPPKKKRKLKDGKRVQFDAMLIRL